MGLELATKLICSFRISGGKVRVVDPFCGDGRLLVALAQHAALKRSWREALWHVELWDNDKQATLKAKATVSTALSDAGIDAHIVTRHWDTFLDSSAEFGNFDVVVTNPPWESLKPDRRELRDLSAQARQSYKEGLREYDSLLADYLPNSQPATKLYGWGTNLSRCGLEVSMRLLQPDGSCGIVLPSSVFADQVSAPLRKWILRQAELMSIDHYPAEAKPFKKVDQPSVFAVIQRSAHPGPVQPVLTRHDRCCKRIASERILLCADDLERLKYRIPTELSSQELSLLLRFSQLRPLSDWGTSRGGELWMGRELDETGYRSFVAPAGEFGFIKGRDVTRFGQVGPVRQFIRAGARDIPRSAAYQRVTWRDVSRRSQARRMVATMIPSGVVTGNSLHVAHFSDGDPQRLYALLGVLNSLVFEFQLRSRLGTGHVSLGTVRGIHVPDLDDAFLVRRLAQLVDRALSGDLAAEVDIEATIADAVSLSREEREVLASHFVGLPPAISDRLLGGPTSDINSNVEKE